MSCPGFRRVDLSRQLLWLSPALPGRTKDLTATITHRIIRICERPGVPILGHVRGSGVSTAMAGTVPVTDVVVSATTDWRHRADHHSGCSPHPWDRTVTVSPFEDLCHAREAAAKPEAAQPTLSRFCRSKTKTASEVSTAPATKPGLETPDVFLHSGATTIQAQHSPTEAG